MNSSQKSSKKGLQKKCDRHQTDRQTSDRQTDRIGPISSSSGVVFWTAKTQIPFAKTSKTCPQNRTRNSLKNPVKGHLRLASVVSLSSNGACGAKNGNSRMWGRKVGGHVFEVFANGICVL